MSLVRKADGRYYVRVWHGGKQVWRSLRTRRRPGARAVAEAETRLWRELGRTDRAAGSREPTPVEALTAEFERVLRANRSAGHALRTLGLVREAAAAIGGTRVTDWTAPAIERFLIEGMTAEGWREGRRKWSPRTGQLARQSIGRFLGWCAKRGEIGESPIHAVEKPRIETHEVKPPARRGVVGLLRAARSWDEALQSGGREAWLEFAVRLDLGTGLRLGELKGLEWTDIDLRLRELTVRAEISKSHRDRVVPLTKMARRALAGVPAADRQGRVLGGHLLGSGNRSLQKACRRRKIPEVSWQTLRQWYCSALAMAGVPMPTVQRLAGHAAISTTAKYYTAVSHRHAKMEIARAGY